MKFIIIGGDAAGMSAAGRAKRNRPETEVIVLEQTGDVSYSACGMPYNIADAKRDMDDLVVRRAHVFREKQGIDLRTGHRVDSMDPSGKRVSGRGPRGEAFDLSYDRLLIATGSSAVVPDLPGFDLPGVMALKSLEDGKKIKLWIREHQVDKAVIIGMGYIALEMSEALRERGIAVEMVKPRPVLLPRVHEQLAMVVKKELEAHQVGLHFGNAVERIEKRGSGLRVCSSNLEMECGMVLVAVGIRPNSRLAEQAGLTLGPEKSIAVDRTLLTSEKDIFSAGDCADAYHVVTGEKTWIPLALRANRAGWAAADNVTGTEVELQGVAGTAVFKVFDLQVAQTGLTEAEAQKAGFEPSGVVIESRSRAHAHPGSSPLWVHMVGDRRSGRLLGVQMVGREGAAHRVNAPAVALHAGMTVEEFAQSDLAYAPPFSPVWDPMLTAANQLLKQMGR